MGGVKVQDKIHLVPFHRLVVLWCKTYETACNDKLTQIEWF